MTTSFIEMLELPNFGHMTTSTIKFEPRDKNFFLMSQTDRSYDVITFISKYQFLRSLRVANFADIIKNSTMFTKTTFEEKLKDIEFMH